MLPQRFLLFRSGSDSCAIALSCVREIARHRVLAPVEDGTSRTPGRVNAHGRIAEAIVPGDSPIENPALCILTELEDGTLAAFVAEEILGVHEQRGAARLLVGPRASSAA